MAAAVSHEGPKGGRGGVPPREAAVFLFKGEDARSGGVARFRVLE